MEEAIGPKSVARFSDKPMLGGSHRPEKCEAAYRAHHHSKNNPNRKALRLSVGSCRFALAWLPQKKTFNFHWDKNGSFWSVAYLVR
ncbi:MULTISPECIES: hypothetical protein [Rhizobium/Agrobacterium group]|uniref:hypothetical protein n=1 Tax=Rhizobium/Agrobacterium group TaxID=227290 RepID=UPI001177992F|nr:MULTISPECIES: hypothetical protein [Rhizobium/Agrobacterium group]NSZ42537.1 hypothetical protein [Agrobacterium vitis]NTA26245.1 hypothetical protein [Allorhizobium ampelinum]